MGAPDILNLIRDSGLSLTVDGARLIVMPAEKLTDELRTLIRVHKPEILAALEQAVRALEDARQATAELTRLVQVCGDRYGFTEAEHREALTVALADPVDALACFRSIAAEKGAS